jgi:hypothetical protein
MIGDEWPSPAMGCFHAMFSVALHFVGTFFSELMPSPLGPRQLGQFTADKVAVNKKSEMRIRTPGA